MNGLFLKRTPSMASLIAALDQSVTRIGISGVRYTRRQLYYEFCRTLLPPRSTTKQPPVRTWRQWAALRCLQRGALHARSGLA